MNRYYDIAIIGGGIQGVAVAQAAAAQGYSVLLLEKTALAAGTSSRSSKLVHGGLRYLESGHFKLVAESLRERADLLRLAPSLVKLQPFHIPVYRHTTRSPWMLRLGLSLYALLARFGTGSGFSSVARKQWGTLDGLSTDGLQHVFRYWDAQTDDQALTQAIMQSAQSLGAMLICPAEFTQAVIADDQCDIEFRQNGQIHACSASVLINAAGPWVEQVAERVSPRLAPFPVELVQGTHLVLDGELKQGCYYMESPQDQRAIFALPWKHHILLGTTETIYHGTPDNTAPLAIEERYLLDCFQHYFPRHNVSVLSRFAGLRVLPAESGAVFRRSREIHLQGDRSLNPRIVGIYGGKLTTSRATAQKVMRLIKPSLPARIAKADVSQLSLELQ
ncbi:MAG TPA: FAD-dependent oxidoreductase [Nitrosomonas mobilis]|nr:FAD-dependent oxidoreductase [Nitrosomonas mobilis]